MNEVQLLCGDCREILPGLKLDKRRVALITDPPYGVEWKTPVVKGRPKAGWKIEGDDQPFDPQHLLNVGAPIMALFGAQHYASRLPDSPGWIIWDKRCGMPSNDQGDADLIWTNKLGRTLIIRYVWNGGGSLLAENGSDRAIHPSQKPVAVMRWLIERLTKHGDTVLDPYVGVGSTGVAAVQLGRDFIGIEIKPDYFARAQKRVYDAQAQLSLFTNQEEVSHDEN